MQLVVSHVTRMQPGYICVAGVEITRGKRVRPVTYGRLPTSLLAREGGPFDMAALVELGPVSHARSRRMAANRSIGCK